MRRLIYAIAALIVGSVAAAAIVPYLVDGDAYRPKVAAAVEAATGLEARLDGDVRFALLPWPVLTVDRLSAGLGDDGRKTVEIETVTIELAPLPLFAGRAVPRAITVTRPVINPGATGISDDAAAALSRLFLVLPDLGALAVRDGTILCREPWMGGLDRFSNVAMDLIRSPAVDEPIGAGTATVGALPIDFTVFTADIRRLTFGDDNARVTLELRGSRALCPTAFDGTVAVHHGSLSAEGDIAYRHARDGAAPTLDVTLKAERVDQSDLAAALGRVLAFSRPVGLRLGVALAIDSTDVAGYRVRDLKIAVSATGAGPISAETDAILPGNAAVKLFGTVSAGEAPQFEGRAEMRANALAPVLDAFDLPAAFTPGDGSGPSVLTGDLLASGSEIRLANLRLSSGGLTLSGEFVARPAEWPSFSFALSSGNNGDSPEIVLDLNRHDDGSDAWDFDARIAAAAEALDLSGSARLEPGDPSAVLKASVEASAINVDDLFDRLSGATVPGQLSATAPVMGALALLQERAAEVEIAAAGLTYRGERIDAPRLVLRWRDGTLGLDVVSGRYRGGSITGAITARPGNPIDVSGQMAIKGAAVSGLDDGPVGLAAGRVDADLSVSGAGRTMADVLSRLEGGGRLTMSDAVVKGLDLDAINKQLAAKRRSVGVVGILSQGLLRGRTAVPTASGTLKIENGIVVLGDAEMVAEGGRAEIFGSADLNRAILDAAAHLRFDAHPAAPPVILRLSGAVAAPNFTLDPKPFQRWLRDNRPK